MKSINFTNNSVSISEDNEKFFEYSKIFEKFNLKEKITKTFYSKKEIDKLFEKIFEFGPSGLKAKIGESGQHFNEYTVHHLHSIFKHILKEENKKGFIVSTNNEKNIEFFKNFSEILGGNDIPLTFFENNVKTLSQLSYAVDETKTNLGIYILNHVDYFEIKILHSDGSEFKDSEYEQLNVLLRQNKFQYHYNRKNFQEISVNKIPKKIETNFLALFFKNQLISKNFFNKKIVIVSQSDSVYQLLQEIRTMFLPNIIVVKNKKTIYDISNPEAFASGYKIFKKEQEFIFFTFDPSGEKFNIAIKINNLIKFLNPLEFNLLNIEMFKNDFNIELDKNLPSFLNQNTSYVRMNKKSLVLKDDFCYSINNKKYNNFLLPFLVYLEKYFANKFYFQDTLRKIENDHGYYSFKKISTKKTYKEFNQFVKNIKKYKKLDSIIVNEINLIEEDKFKVFYKLKTNLGEVNLIFDKFSSLEIIIAYSKNKNFIQVVNEKTELVESFEKYSISKNEYKQFFTKKKVIGLVISFLAVVLILSMVFTYLFNWEQIIQATKIIAGSWNSSLLYINIFNLLTVGFISAIVTYFAFKEFKPDTKFKDNYIASVLSIFFFLITPFPVFGIGFWIWYLKHKKYKTSEVLSVATIQVLLSVASSFIYSSSLSFYSYYFLDSLSISIPWLYYVGFTSIFLFWMGSGTTILAAYSKRIQLWILKLIEYFSFTFNMTKGYSRFYEKFTYGVENNRQNIKTVLRNKSLFIFLIVLSISTAVQSDLILYSSLNMVTEFYGFPPILNFFNVASLNAISGFASGVVPNNGGILLADTVIRGVISAITGSTDLATQFTFIFRFFTYYAVIIVTMPFFVFFTAKVISKSKDSKVIWV